MSTFLPDEEELPRESHDGEEDVDNLRSNTADQDQAQSTLLSPSATTYRGDICSETTGLKPAFWMTDYKQPKRCKKNGCAFETASKVSRNRFIRLYSVASVCILY